MSTEKYNNTNIITTMGRVCKDLLSKLEYTILHDNAPKTKTICLQIEEQVLDCVDIISSFFIIFSLKFFPLHEKHCKWTL